jgi:AcrR family transcriptional regulator
MSSRRAAPSSGPASPPQLSEDEIITAAMGIVQRDGVRQLTMRGLATDLGVTAAAIYYYFPGKGALVQAVADAVLDTVKTPGPAVDWVEELRRYILESRAALAAHPGVAALFVRETQSPTMLRHVGAVLELLRSAGFSAREAMEAFSMTTTFVLGSAILEERHIAAAGRDDLRARLRAAGDASDLGVFAAVSEELRSTEEIDHFRYGVDLMLAGLQAQLGQARASSRPRRSSTAG